MSTVYIKPGERIVYNDCYYIVALCDSGNNTVFTTLVKTSGCGGRGSSYGRGNEYGMTKADISNTFCGLEGITYQDKPINEYFSNTQLYQRGDIFETCGLYYMLAWVDGWVLIDLTGSVGQWWNSPLKIKANEYICDGIKSDSKLWKQISGRNVFTKVDREEVFK